MAVIKWIGIALLTLVILVVLLLVLMSSNLGRDIAAQQISERTGRKLTIDGELNINWSLTPHIRVEQIQFENAAWSKQPHMLELAALDFRIDLIELINGHVILPEIILTKPNIVLEKSPDGEPNWEFRTDIDDKEDRAEFPIIERLQIEEGRLVYRDLSENTEIIATFGTTKGRADGEEVTKLQAEGKLKGSPLAINLTAGPLVALREAKVPYPLTLSLQAGETAIKVQGSLTEPLQLKGIDLQFAMKGPDPGQLSDLFGLPMPNLPPYQLKGDLSFHEDTWQIKKLDGHVGASHLAGNISVKIGEQQPFIKAELTSNKIVLNDFGPIIGIAPETELGETPSTDQKEQAKKQAASPYVLPKKSINFDELQKINANITLQSKHVESKLPVDKLFMRAIIDNGHLILDPLNFEVATGSMQSYLEFDTGTKPVKSKIETEIRHVRLNEILRRFKIAEESAGLIGGQATFWFKGNSVAEMLASADGGLVMIMTGGQLDKLLVELAGLDLGEALVALFDKKATTEINCAFVDLPTTSGVMKIGTFVIDTDDTVFFSKGSIDFKKEQLDLVIDPNPKDFSVFSARAPLHIGGSFKEPNFTVGARAIVRGAFSLALLPSAPIVSLYSLLQGNEKGQKDDIQNSDRCSRFIEALNEARE
jgi:AsmA family protein